MKCRTIFSTAEEVPARRAAFFFDLDGTLVDSAPDIRACLFEALQEHDVRIDGMAERFKIGPPLDMMISAMAPDLSEELLVSVVKSFRKRYDQSDYPLTVPFAGVEALLAELMSLGLPLYVATHKPVFASTRIVNKIGWHFFEAILSPDSFGKERLTKAQLLQRAVCERGYRKDKCLMIGDLTEDVNAAKQAGLGSVAVTWGYGDAAALARCGADWLVSDPSELVAIGKGLFDV